MQCACLSMGLFKPPIGGVAYIGSFLMRRVFSGLSANRRVSTSFQVIRERTAARSIEQRLQMCVATNAGSEAVAIGLPKCVDASVASFLTDLPVAFTSVIAAEALFLSPLALSNSFFWHATLISDSSEPEPYSQLRIRVRSSTALRSLPTTQGCLKPQASPQCTTAVGPYYSPETRLRLEIDFPPQPTRGTAAIRHACKSGTGPDN